MKNGFIFYPRTTSHCSKKKKKKRTTSHYISFIMTNICNAITMTIFYTISDQSYDTRIVGIYATRAGIVLYYLHK